MSTLSNDILSKIVVYNKYSRYLKDKKRRESYEEICKRVADMHVEKYPQLKTAITDVFKHYVTKKKILPSMRSMQFAGVPIERNPTRIYNCAYMPIEHIKAFSETMFLLLGGTGVGYSVQKHHVAKLPVVVGPNSRTRRFVIGDSIEGWADAIRVLIESHFLGKPIVEFDYGDIREKGVELVTSGGKAPGPDPLRVCLVKLDILLHSARGRRLSPINAHDILCHIADAVLAGGIRRAAMIALFSHDDVEMLTCKSGAWWEENPQRGRANNSVVLLREATTKEIFSSVWERVVNSGSGEPGIYWTNDLDWGTNPCAEIALRPYQFCNLVEVNVSDVESQEDFNERCKAASFIATLQAGYTNFHYLRPIWKQTTEEDALIGVGLTGIGSNKLASLSLTEAAKKVNETNEEVARTIGINPASRTTTVKPSGTSSLVLGCSSGVHAWHSDYYLRRIRVSKVEPLYLYLKDTLPDLVEDDYEKPNIQAIIAIPQEAPKNSLYRTESALSLFSRALRFNLDWVQSGYIKGMNHNNVSCTLSIKPHEWELMSDHLWNYRYQYNGMSVLPYDGGTYRQAPFEDITEEEFKRLEKFLHKIDLTDIYEGIDATSHSAEPACAGGVCEVG